MRKRPGRPEHTKAMGHVSVNHRESITAMGVCTVPTLTLGVLYCFFVLTHCRRCALHGKVIRRLNSACVVQQQSLNVFPYDVFSKYQIFNRMADFNGEVLTEENPAMLPTSVFGWNLGEVLSSAAKTDGLL
jgi:hypothetical protein